MIRPMHALRIAASAGGVFAVVVAALVAFGAGTPPPPLSAVNAAFAGVD